MLFVSLLFLILLGNEVLQPFADPSRIPSRAYRLTEGPAVFASHKRCKLDLLEMTDMWSDIFHAQRELAQLDFIEKRLPSWLQAIDKQDG